MTTQRSRKKNGAAKSKRKSRSMAAHASSDAVLRKPAEMFSTPEAWFGLMSKNAAAFADLQMRLIRCRSPVELWTEQLRYIKGRIDDAQAVLKVSVTSRLREPPGRGSAT